MLPLLAVLSCAPPARPPAPVDAVPLNGTVWRASDLGYDNLLVTASQTELRIDAVGKVTGNTGCNEFTGTASQDGASITFSPLEVSGRACNEQVMAQERAILGALEDARVWAISGRFLAFYDARGRPLMKLVRAKPPAP